MQDSTDTVNIGYLVSHPIQYQAPLLRRIAAVQEWNFKVFFRSDISVRGAWDPQFGKHISWDTDLLSGYDYQFLPGIIPSNRINSFLPINVGLVKALKQSRIDVLIIHGYGYLYNLYAVFAAKACGVRVFLRDEAHGGSRVRSGLGELKARLVFRYLNHFVDGFLAIGSANARYYRSRGVSDAKIFLVPYAVDNQHFAVSSIEQKRQARLLASAEYGISAKSRVIAFASKLLERKRCLDLILAFAELRKSKENDVALLVVGEGSQRKSLEGLVDELGLRQCVRFLGFLNQSALPSIYRAADVLVLPSEHEPWGVVVNEAMAGGCGIIVTDQVGSGFDLVRSGENGFVYRVGDIEDLANCLKRFFSNDELICAAQKRSLSIIKTWSFDQDLDGLRDAIRSLT
jgi:glycosyltransferase involved in cell wall biosynthesis